MGACNALSVAWRPGMLPQATISAAAAPAASSYSCRAAPPQNPNSMMTSPRPAAGIPSLREIASPPRPATRVEVRESCRSKSSHIFRPTLPT